LSDSLKTIVPFTQKIDNKKLPLTKKIDNKEFPLTKKLDNKELPPIRKFDNKKVPPIKKIDNKVLSQTKKVDSKELPPTKMTDKKEPTPVKLMDNDELPPLKKVDNNDIPPTKKMDNKELSSVKKTDIKELPPFKKVNNKLTPIMKTDDNALPSVKETDNNELPAVKKADNNELTPVFPHSKLTPVKKTDNNNLPPTNKTEYKEPSSVKKTDDKELPPTKKTDNKQEKTLKLRKTSLVLLGLTELLGGATLSLLAPFYTNEAETHGVSVTASGTVFASVFIVQIILTPVFGKFISRLGSVNLFVYGAVVTGLTNIAFAFIPLIDSGPVFLAMSLLVRSATAMGEAAVFTAVYPLATERATEGKQSRVLGWMETMFGLGTTIGPFVGGALYELGGFYLPFIVCGALLVMCGLAGVCVLDKGKVEEEVEVDPGVKYRTLLGVPSVLVGAIVLVLTGASTEWYQPSLEPYVRSQFGLTPFQASLFFMVDGGSYALATPVWGLLLDKGLDSRAALILGSGIICLSYLGLGPIPPLTPSITQVCITTALHGVGMAANFLATLTIMLSAGGKRVGGEETEQLRGMVTSLWITFESVGGFLGATGGGAAYDSVGWLSSCVMVAGLQLAGMLLVVGVWLAMATRVAGTDTPTSRDVEKAGEVEKIQDEIEERTVIVLDKDRMGKREGYGTMRCAA